METPPQATTPQALGPDGYDAHGLDQSPNEYNGMREELNRESTAAVTSDDAAATTIKPLTTNNSVYQNQGMLVSGYHPASEDNEEEEPCGICLEFRGKGRMVELCCCGNTMCVKDAQLVGVCPFCREEPLVWDFKTV